MDKQVIREVIAANPNFTETRKMSLYSNFGRLQGTNDVGFRANVTAWQEVLEQAVRAGAFTSSLSFEAGPQLLEALSDAKNGQPIALNTVIDQMVAEQKLVPASTFITAKYPVLTATWAPGQIAGRFAMWALGKVVNTNWRSGDVGKLKPAKYIVVSQVKPAADNLLRLLKNDYRENGSTYTAGIFSYQQVREVCGLNADDLDICLVYLSRETNALQYDPKQRLVKLEGKKIEASDGAIPSMKDLLAQQAVRLTRLDVKIAGYNEQARSMLKQGDRGRAKQALRAKHASEKMQTQIMEQQNQLELVLAKIDEATDQVNMVEALQAGKQLLAERNRAVGGVDRVTEILDSVQDEISETDKVSEQLANLSMADNEDEVLEELEALAAEEKAKEHNPPTDKSQDAVRKLAELEAPTNAPKDTETNQAVPAT